jgi:hypothetical protein
MKLLRPGTEPSSNPASPEQSTNEVSHGSDRFQVMPSKIQRTEPNRVSSIPSLLVGSGSGSHLAAAATSAWWAVRHDTPYSAATSETARLLEAIAWASCSRNRSATRAEHAPLPRPGRMTAVDTAARHRPAGASATTLDCLRAGPPHGQDTELRLQTEHTSTSGQHPGQHLSGSLITSVMLVASLLKVVRDQQHPGGHEPPTARTRSQASWQTPLKIKEPDYWTVIMVT